MQDYTKFYTPSMVAKLLVDQCGDLQPKNMIDICAGSWNLLNAARSKWSDAEVTGVDVDNRSSGSVIADGRLFVEKSLQQRQYYDLVLANPPFQWEVPLKDITDIINKRIQKFNGYVYSRLESTMLLFNSLLVGPGGTLASIVPDSILSSEKQRELRIYLSNSFHLEKIIKLPQNAFGSRGINTSIVIFKNRNSQNPTEIFEVESIGCSIQFSSRKMVPYQEIRQGNWDRLRNLDTEAMESGHVDPFQIFRNNISSSQMKGETPGIPVIHSSSVSETAHINHGKLRYKREFDLVPSYQYTREGDITVVRVGKGCGTYAVITERETGLLTSDCILLLRPYNAEVGNVLVRYLSSLDRIRYVVKGVAARYITKTDLQQVLRHALRDDVLEGFM